MRQVQLREIQTETDGGTLRVKAAAENESQDLFSEA
jgi:hypothetical protein